MSDEENMSPEEIDPEAPFGRKSNGEPYKTSPEHRAKIGAQVKAKRWGGGKSGPPLRRKKPPAATSSRKTDYRPALVGLLQIPTMVLGFLGKKNPAFAADAATFAVHGELMAQAVQDTADQDERLAEYLDKVLKVGPYGAIISAATIVGLQIASNHGKIPANPDMGIFTKEQLIAELARRQGAAVPVAA